MNIPDKAVEAAARDLLMEMMERQNPAMSTGDLAPFWDTTPPDHRDYYMRIANRALESAAPFIAAQALKDHATAVVTHRVNAVPAFFEGMKFSALLAMDHASHIEEEQ